MTCRRFPSGLILLCAVALLIGVTARADVPAEPTPAAAEAARSAATLTAQAAYIDAAARYDEATDLLKGSLFADDAAFLRIAALEAADRDDEAGKLWEKWTKRYGDSPLAGQAALALGWNLLRQDRPEEAARTIGRAVEDSPWLLEDERVRTLLAALAYAGGDYERALEHLTANHPGDEEAATRPAASRFLEGLCHEQLGGSRRAAIAYQRLLDRCPDTPLRGYAHLAKGRIYGLEEDYRFAVTEFEQLAGSTSRSDLRAECRFLAAASRFLGGDRAGGINRMAELAKDEAGHDMAPRTLFALGEMRWLMGDFEVAITRFNQVLSQYFDDELAGSALYRTGRCLDALDRTVEANSAYQAVAAGYPYAPEAPAAIYLAGVGLLEQDQPRAAAPYFQLVLDRYAPAEASFVFDSPGHQELVEASLCLLEYSYHLTGQPGALAGAPHLFLQRMPPSRSLWRAYSLLLDADALAAQARFPESQAALDRLLIEFPDHPVGIRANRLLAWTYTRQGRQDLAIATEERMLARYTAGQDDANLSAARLTMAHSLFNEKKYQAAAEAYGEFLRTAPGHPQTGVATYQQGLCFLRLGRDGDAVDAWQRILAADPASETARDAWRRAGDVYFQAGHFELARDCFDGLLANFSGSDAQAAALLRLGRCDYNEGDGPAARARFRELRARYPESAEAREAETDLTQVLYGMGQEGDPACFADLARDFPDSPLAPEARFELALLRYDAGEFETAAALFAELAARYPAYSGAGRATFLAVDSREQTGDLDGAEQGWARFLADFPANELAPTATFRLASLHFRDGRYLQASDEYDAVLAAEAGDEIHAAALLNRALCRSILNDDAGARRALDDYRKRDFPAHERDVQVARLLGEIHERAGRWTAAAVEYRRAVELGAAEAEAIELNYLAGSCLDRAGDRAAALGSYGQSIAGRDKSNTFRLSALAQVAALQEESGDLREALLAYRDLIENADDPALIGAAKERADQLEAVLGR